MAEARARIGGHATFWAEHRASFGIGGGDGTPCDAPAKLITAGVGTTPETCSGNRQHRLFARGLNADLARDGPRDVLERLCRGTRLALSHGRHAHVGALAKRDVERDPAQEV